MYPATTRQPAPQAAKDDELVRSMARWVSDWRALPEKDQKCLLNRVRIYGGMELISDLIQMCSQALTDSEESSTSNHC